MRGSTLLVLLFLAGTIVPAFVAFALTPSDARVVTNVQGWNGCAYTVRRGDNLFRIGVRHGVTYQYLAQINGIYNPNFILAGETISVPCGPVPYYPNYRPWNQNYWPPYECPWCQPLKIPDKCAQNIDQYTVQPGNSLFRIAVQFGSTIQWIRTQNKLWGKILRPGIVLTIPCVGEVDYSHVPPLTPGQPTGIITASPVPTVQPGGELIRMKNRQFNPPIKTVRVGTTVVWENKDDGDAYVIQNVGGSEAFTSPPIPPGGSYQHTFNTPGTYTINGISFPGMTGEVQVNP